jgi:superfamily II DNA helicase RecQ
MGQGSRISFTSKPHSIIDYAQESRRAGRVGERVIAVVVIEEKDWPEEVAARDSCLELKRREVNSFIWTKGCRHMILMRCL